MAKVIIKSITLKHVGRHCRGTATLNLWGGGVGTVDMDSWETEKGSRKEIVKGVNDGQFGCESIQSATVEVFDLYEGGHKVYDGTINFSEEELREAKRGI